MPTIEIAVSAMGDNELCEVLIPRDGSTLPTDLFERLAQEDYQRISWALDQYGMRQSDGVYMFRQQPDYPPRFGSRWRPGRLEGKRWTKDKRCDRKMEIEPCTTALAERLRQAMVHCYRAAGKEGQSQ